MKTFGGIDEVGARRAIGAAALAVLVGGCAQHGILDPVGPVASAEKQILINSTAIMLAIIIPTMLATAAFAFWFRRGNTRATYMPDWEYSGAIELVVWSIPALTIMLLGGIAWIGSHDLDPAKPLSSTRPPLHVQVVSLDWKWLFIYPDQGIATVNQLVVPAGTQVSFDLTSATVWNSFFVPQMGSQIYTMPRMTTRLNLEADKPGTYPGLSAHFSGDGFPGMQFKVQVLPADQFGMWAQGAHGQGKALDTNGYAALSKPSSYVQPITYGAVAHGLYDAIVADKVPQLHLPQAAPPVRQASAVPAGG
ncbi:ubiquinol oxidase subunit II [Sphingomonas sp.]|uniref:ubiquinol oxidase subunit II n=1 Tax=Sphingomonas sp. TaxID=28214 RepID=UPI0025D5E7FC|nr:ubiquinol oxidase subunit II [Sphingomonas sp.]MBV9526776.1 ubiquinol oxidase subunit II [Sphingomonas sp.]